MRHQFKVVGGGSASVNLHQISYFITSGATNTRIFFDNGQSLEVVATFDDVMRLMESV